MSLTDAVIATGDIPSDKAKQAEKKRFSEILSARLAEEVAQGLRDAGFPEVRPEFGGPGERPFQGGLGSKKVDVSYADEQHGLLLAVSIKSINFPPFGKNLKNRFADLCTEAISLHMRFPYAVIAGFFAMPIDADNDMTALRTTTTFRRAVNLFSTISGRKEYTDPGEKFENVSMMLYQPAGTGPEPWVKIIDCDTREEISETDYFTHLRDIYNTRNPHSIIDDS